MNQFKFGDHVKHPKHKGKLIFIESFEEVSLLKKEWAEVLSEEAGDFVFVPLEELEPASPEEAPATKYRHINGHKFPEPCSEPFKDGQSYFAVSLEAGAEVSHYRWYDDNHETDSGIAVLSIPHKRLHRHTLMPSIAYSVVSHAPTNSHHAAT